MKWAPLLVGVLFVSCAGLYGRDVVSGDKHPFAEAIERADDSDFDGDVATRLAAMLPPIDAPIEIRGPLWDAPGAPAVEPAPRADRPHDDRTDDRPLSVRRALALSYLRHYRLGEEAEVRRLGRISDSLGETAVFVFESPGADRPAVLYLHGYLDHSAMSRYPIGELLRRGYTVIAVDLPGHGLSSGERGAIDDFSRYAQVIEAVVGAVRRGEIAGVAADAPLSAIGHSTGAAAIIEHGERYGSVFDSIVLVAPLVRLYAFPLARMGVRVASAIIDALPRRISGSSSNEHYVEFAREHDPLGIYEAPLDWAEAYLEWEKRRRELRPRSTPTLLLQAGRDSVVDAEYNTEFLRRFFSDLQVIEYPDARHSLFTEPEHLRDGIYDRIDDFLHGR